MHLRRNHSRPLLVALMWRGALSEYVTGAITEPCNDGCERLFRSKYFDADSETELKT